MGAEAEHRKLTAKETLFVFYYCGDAKQSAAEAARLAGYGQKGARTEGPKILSKPAVQAAVAAIIGKRLEKQDISGRRVLAEIAGSAFADANDLAEVRVGCCRFCWGTDHKYQWTEAEFAKELAQNVGVQAPGGTGFDRRREPHPECPECFGEGEARVVLKDSAKASSDAKKAYAGAEVTEKGIRVRIHDKLKANEMLGRHFKLFKDNIQVTFPDLPPEMRRKRILELLTMAAKQKAERTGGSKRAG